MDPAMIAMAVAYMEGAIRNGTDPETFAGSARSQIPDSVINALRARGVDAFLSDVASLEASSPLHSIAGRTWVREVAAVLVGGA